MQFSFTVNHQVRTTAYVLSRVLTEIGKKPKKKLNKTNILSVLILTLRMQGRLHVSDITQQTLLKRASRLAESRRGCG